MAMSVSSSGRGR
jgi:hypothetical protein